MKHTGLSAPPEEESTAETVVGMLFPRRVDFRIVGRIDESIAQFRKAQAGYRKR